MSRPKSVLLIACPDRAGLIHRITGVLSRHGFNITENHEFVDHGSQAFFMRTEIAGDVPAATVLADLKKELPETSALEVRPQAPRRLVLLATKEPHCLGDLLLRHSAGELRAEILAVVSQYETLRSLVERFGIPFHCVPVAGAAQAGSPTDADRVAHENALEKVIAPYRPDLLVLAKYMRVLTPSFVARYPNRILNIHHSFLPAFIGKNPYAQAHERGVKIIGATAHFVTDNLDEGPIITQSVIPCSHVMDALSLARAGRDVEKIVLARALNLLLEDRVMVQGSRTLVFE